MQDNDTPTKTCVRCENALTVGSFNKCSANPDGLQRYCRECQRIAKANWNKENRAHQAAYNNAYYHAHPEQGKDTRSRWVKNNRIQSREVKKRSKLVAVGVAVERVDYKAILAQHGMMCHVCGGAIATEDDLHFDHVIPICQGGPHTMENIMPAHAKCNMGRKRRPRPRRVS